MVDIPPGRETIPPKFAGCPGEVPMSVPKKSFQGKQPPTKAHPPTGPARPGADDSLLLQGVKAKRAGPGMTWINLTRKDVEEKLSEYRQRHAAKSQESLWGRLANAFRMSKKGH